MATRTQLLRLQRTAESAYDRISKALQFDPDLDDLNELGLDDYAARAQGALLDLHSAISAHLSKTTRP